MAGTFNKVSILGRLGHSPEIKEVNNIKRATLSLATSESWKDKVTGERKEKTEWHRVIVMNEKLIDFIGQYVKKGTRVYIEGKIQTRKWTGQDNIERYTTEIIIDKFKGSLMIVDSIDKDDHGTPEGKPLVRVKDNDDIPF